jgi:hypothetical protein
MEHRLRQFESLHKKGTQQNDRQESAFEMTGSLQNPRLRLKTLMF